MLPTEEEGTSTTSRVGVIANRSFVIIISVISLVALNKEDTTVTCIETLMLTIKELFACPAIGEERPRRRLPLLCHEPSTQGKKSVICMQTSYVQLVVSPLNFVLELPIKPLRGQLG